MWRWPQAAVGATTSPSARRRRRLSRRFFQHGGRRCRPAPAAAQPTCASRRWAVWNVHERDGGGRRRCSAMFGVVSQMASAPTGANVRCTMPDRFHQNGHHLAAVGDVGRQLRRWNGSDDVTVGGGTTGRRGSRLGSERLAVVAAVRRPEPQERHVRRWNGRGRRHHATTVVAAVTTQRGATAHFGTTRSRSGARTNSDTAGSLRPLRRSARWASATGATRAPAIARRARHPSTLLDEVDVAARGCTGAPLLREATIPVRTLQADPRRRQGATSTSAARQVVASSTDRAALAGADLRGVNLRRRQLPRRAGRPHRHPPRRRHPHRLNFALADLTGATLTNVSAAGASFEGADLSAEGCASGRQLLRVEHQPAGRQLRRRQRERREASSVPT